MCGLVGIAGDTNGTWKDVFSELLLIDVVRGPHSTGAGFVGRNDEKLAMAKAIGHPFNLFADDEYDELMSTKKHHKVMLGHNRFATIGEKTVDNAHPFMFDHTIGMHNGTLDKWCLNDLYKADEFGTDSESVIASINEWGIEETVKKMAGAWALIWYDKITHTLNFLRNDRRPLHYCYSEDRCTLVWASEADMLRYVMARKGKKILGADKDNTGIYIVTPNTHYSWHIPQATNKKIDAPEQVKREGRAWAYQYSGPTHSGSKGHTTGSHSTQDAFSNVHYLSKKQKKRKIRELSSIDTAAFRPPYKDMYGRVINKPQMEHMAACGCCFCNDDTAQWGDFVHILGAWTGPNSTPFVCESCFNDADIGDILEYSI